MRLLFIDERVSLKMLLSWFNENGNNKCVNSVCELLRYRLLIGYDINGNEIKVKNINESIDINIYLNFVLHKEFREQLIVYINNYNYLK